MAKFELNQRVVAIHNGEVKRGRIESLYETLNMAIVRYDDGDIAKLNLGCLGVEPEAPVQSEEEPTEEAPHEREENPTITISEDELRTKGTRIIARETIEMGPTGFMIGLAMSTVFGKILKELFYD